MTYRSHYTSSEFYPSRRKRRETKAAKLRRIRAETTAQLRRELQADAEQRRREIVERILSEAAPAPMSAETPPPYYARD